ncbi:MAG: transcriptional regulator [Candidatus Geothermarchaeota archaeon]
MSKDQIIGWLLLIGSLLGIVVYFWLLFFVAPQLVMQITAFVAVAGVLGILAWIGYTLATTPPPKPIEEIEKEIEQELKSLESKGSSEAPRVEGSKESSEEKK